MAAKAQQGEFAAALSAAQRAASPHDDADCGLLWDHRSPAER
eukprot:gene452-33162_t